MMKGKQEIAVRVGAEDEASLVEAAKSNPQAFAELYRRYLTPVYRYLYRRVDHKSDAEDLTSQVFMDVLEGLVHYRNRGNFSAWLFTIAHNKAVDYYRSQRNTLPLENVEGQTGKTPDPPEQMEDKQALARLEFMIDQLDEDKQELLRLRYAASLTYAEIGNLLGRSEGAVKMALHRLIHQLQNEWEHKV